MGRIDAIFADLDGTRPIIPFVVAGDPSLEATEAVIPALHGAGAPIIEIGIPFSDPIADGPVIAAAMYRALERGVTPRAVLDMVRRLRPTTDAAIVAMVSDSIVFRLGGERFVAMLAEAGFDGLIVPDLDSDAAASIAAACDRHDLSFTQLIAPTTPLHRLRTLAQQSSGFLYVLARAGLTGERGEGPSGLAERIAAIRNETDLPLAVGFGISTADQVETVTSLADAAIVGSALVRRLADAADPAAEAAAMLADLTPQKG